MTDTTTTETETQGGLRIGNFDVQAFLQSGMKGEVALGVGVLALIIMLIMPMPSILLDMMLAVSITFSVLVLMTSLLIKKPLEFSAFPAVLLLATLLRLGLNLASTRLILSNGAQGPDAAGDVIKAFGSFVMGGNYVIGVIVFIILVIVNFVVISKGSSRIAEVAARFTLDAMPGKQMAIDADLSAGLINEEEARSRRKEVEGESNFFGAMDGASKFVRGDAVAGLLITAINIIGGIVIGVAQEGLAFETAADTYTRLTIGDGLVSQIPALIISIAAGLLVSKAGLDGAADKALATQMMSNPLGLYMVAGCALFAGVLPGMPFIPFAALAGSLGYMAYRIDKQKREEVATEQAATEKAKAAPAEPKEPPIKDSLTVDELKIELGFGLVPLINETKGRKLTDQVKAVRRQIASDYGFVAPSVRIVDNLELPSDNYEVCVKELTAGTGRLKLNHHLAMDASGRAAPVPGERVMEPVFGLPAIWVDEANKEQAAISGYTVVDPATVLTTHFTEIVKENMAELLSFASVKNLLDDLPPEQKALLDDIVPNQISLSGIQRVLQNLLSEYVSIRDLPTILEGIAEASSTQTDLVTVTEHVRSRLGRQLCAAHSDERGELPVVTLSPGWEEAFANAIIGQGGNRQLALEPSRLHGFAGDVKKAFDAAAQQGTSPVLLTSAGIRPFVQSLIERFRPKTPVMSQNEIHPKARLRAAGTV
ncbi:flagellar biosynthesis protein FlhA [Ponticaulis profundi]|uniref:Flagellar biosynthesis protein FlhA n=1 Tax=Ponticaulis profundi TaxID=2665222 RepID=A0ABW1S9Q6_9PROT